MKCNNILKYYFAFTEIISKKETHKHMKSEESIFSSSYSSVKIIYIFSTSHFVKKKHALRVLYYLSLYYVVISMCELNIIYTFSRKQHNNIFLRIYHFIFFCLLIKMTEGIFEQKTHEMKT